LRKGGEILEPCLAGGLLLLEPAHLLEAGRLRQPGKQRISLPRPIDFQRLEPAGKSSGVARRLGSPRRNSAALAIDERTFEATLIELFGEPLGDIGGGQRGTQPNVVELGQAVMEGRRLRARDGS